MQNYVQTPMYTTHMVSHDLIPASVLASFPTTLFKSPGLAIRTTVSSLKKDLWSQTFPSFLHLFFEKKH